MASKESTGAAPLSNRRPWSITIESDDGHGSADARRVELDSEPAEEARVLKELSRAGLPPGSPVARVVGMLSPAGHSSRSIQPSSPLPRSVTHPSSLSRESDRGVTCPLFPGVRPEGRVEGRDFWIAKLNLLLDGKSIGGSDGVMELSEWESLTEEFGKVCSEEDGCPVVSVREGDLLRVVGDIHGQLADLVYCVLGKQSRAEPSKWIFLGDLVDRGPHGVECLAIVALMKILFPDRVTVLRGNHEDAPVTFVYGFWQECDSKFPGSSGAAWYAANAAFTNMPVAAVVDHVPSKKKFWCCHGGLSPHLLREDPVSAVNNAQRRKYGEQRMSTFIPDFDQGATSPLNCPVTTGLIEGLLWSDLTDWDLGRARAGFAPNERGAGCMWESKVSEEFCEKHGFEFICRAHQMMEEGYMWAHSDRVLTIFSAPNYCGQDNKGCVLEIRTTPEKDLKQNFSVFSAAPSGILSLADCGVHGPVIPYFDASDAE